MTMKLSEAILMSPATNYTDTAPQLINERVAWVKPDHTTALVAALDGAGYPITQLDQILYTDFRIATRIACRELFGVDVVDTFIEGTVYPWTSLIDYLDSDYVNKTNSREQIAALLAEKGL